MTEGRKRIDPTYIALIAATVAASLGALLPQGVRAADRNPFNEGVRFPMRHAANFSVQPPAHGSAPDGSNTQAARQRQMPIGPDGHGPARFPAPAGRTDATGTLTIAGDAMQNTAGVVGQNFITARHGAANTGNAITLRLGPVQFGGVAVRR